MTTPEMLRLADEIENWRKLPHPRMLALIDNLGGMGRILNKDESDLIITALRRASQPPVDREAVARALCKADGTAQCAALCLSHFASSTADGKCPHACTVWGRKADAILALTPQEAGTQPSITDPSGCGHDHVGDTALEQESADDYRRAIDDLNHMDDSGNVRRPSTPPIAAQNEAELERALNDALVHGTGATITRVDPEELWPVTVSDKTTPAGGAGAGSFAALRIANTARQKEWDSSSKIDLAFRGNELAGEIGEACNVIKKLVRERLGIGGSRATVAQLAEELADGVICIDLIAMSEGIDLWASVASKFNATSEKIGLQTRLSASTTDTKPAGVAGAELAEQHKAFWEPPAPVTHDRARESATRFINWFFKNDYANPQVSIPARPEYDDDLLLMSYIRQQERSATDARLREALEKIAAFDDAYGNLHLERSDTYSGFDEPNSVKIARAALAGEPKP